MKRILKNQVYLGHTLLGKSRKVSVYKMQYEQIRSMDLSRPVTSATCRHFTDICLDLPDIVSINMYSGWYQDVSVKEGHEKEMDWVAAPEWIFRGS